VLYGTTPEFLERLGLDSVNDLPPLAPLLGADDDEPRAERREEDPDHGEGPSSKDEG
jgi:hypothetical protein